MIEEFRILVAGTRIKKPELAAGTNVWGEYRRTRAAYRKLVFEELDRIAEPFLSTITRAMRPVDIVIVEGACDDSADEFANEWVRWKLRRNPGANVKPERHPANWYPNGKFDKRAGFERNQVMVNCGANYCLCFWDGVSRGTADTHKRATIAGVRRVETIPLARIWKVVA